MAQERLVFPARGFQASYRAEEVAEFFHSLATPTGAADCASQPTAHLCFFLWNSPKKRSYELSLVKFPPSSPSLNRNPCLKITDISLSLSVFRYDSRESTKCTIFYDEIFSPDAFHQNPLSLNNILFFLAFLLCLNYRFLERCSRIYRVYYFWGKHLYRVELDLISSASMEVTT